MTGTYKSPPPPMRFGPNHRVPNQKSGEQKSPKK